ncbi:uncharacterized protein PGTG_17700 [Puccinia graminis f. sp. tritici CRL 75-36-700-3]|uniref:Uncharacterized protein n=1 Tax=Puccinia graminis f. sp. tritici (strain CRL 75-36-700-3 / race SCCL) TaxID=418459 RepID=E3L4H5_PUCGT|nr:uncharacterized protein PGTG_17700 [Puccinia graminis f. sp. tritici CRL 75-36-700-3]EFP91450.1 hypothetical protein PGTG_17700 [Puccinia graminis f. sp. tritici CRL 75-36-700-3]
MSINWNLGLLETTNIMVDSHVTCGFGDICMPTESDFRTGTVVVPTDTARLPWIHTGPSYSHRLSPLRCFGPALIIVHSISPKPCHTSTYRAQMASSTRRRDDNHHARKIFNPYNESSRRR